MDGAGTRKKTETFEPDNSIPGEWIKGTVDFETGERTRKKSWYYYQKIIKDGMVD